MKHLTEDTTNEFNHNQIANKLQELVNFYKVNKESISQVYMEKYAKDHRLGYVLSCLREMDVMLPIFNQIESDGTLYLKEYLLNSGNAQGLGIACTLNCDLLTRALIDNCGLSEIDMESILAGFT